MNEDKILFWLEKATEELNKAKRETVSDSVEINNALSYIDEAIQCIEGERYYTSEDTFIEPVEVTNHEDECKGCYFHDKLHCLLPCSPAERMDGKNVIFVEKKKE